jgi:hypothetical protein
MNTEPLTWDDEALKKIEKAPFFIRKLAKNKVEKAAIAQGETKITVEFVEKIRQKESNS